jgi:hypothetical protein
MVQKRTLSQFFFAFVARASLVAVLKGSVTIFFKKEALTKRQRTRSPLKNIT